MSNSKPKTITIIWHGKLIEFCASLSNAEFARQFYPNFQEIVNNENGRFDEVKAITPLN